jgi:hypothetical protein
MPSDNATARSGSSRALPKGLAVAALVLLVLRVVLALAGGWQTAP